MRILNLAVMLTVLVFLGAGAASAAVSLRDGALQYEQGGKKALFKAEDIAVEAVGNSDLRYVTLSEDQAKSIGKKPLLLIFDKSGALVKETSDIKDVEIEMIAKLSLSPGGTVLAVDNGTWLVRGWSFVSYPQLAPLGKPIAYLANGDEGMLDLAWVDDGSVLTTVIDEKGRAYDGYDPGGVTSVVVHRIRDGKATPVFAGTVLCDYALSAFDGKTVTALKSCGKTAEDWATPEAKEKGITSTTVTGPLPAGR